MLLKSLIHVFATFFNFLNLTNRRIALYPIRIFPEKMLSLFVIVQPLR